MGVGTSVLCPPIIPIVYGLSFGTLLAYKHLERTCARGDWRECPEILARPAVCTLFVFRTFLAYTDYLTYTRTSLMAATVRLSASKQMALSLACEAFADSTQRFLAAPRLDVTNHPEMADAAIHFTVSGKQFDMPVVISPNAPSRAVYDATAIVRNRPRGRLDPAAGRPLMVVTNHVSSRLAATLIANRVPFLDTAGNVYLDEPEATVMITGRRAPRLKHTDLTSRSTTPKGLRVSFALATQPDLVEQPYRTIADASGVALNTVNLEVGS